MTEHWRDIPGWEGLYQARPPRHVRSVDRWVPQKSRWGRPVANLHRGRVLKPFITPSGRLRVVLHDREHRRHARYVDQLLLDTFGVAE
jgi:hypothetical protein